MGARWFTPVALAVVTAVCAGIALWPVATPTPGPRHTAARAAVLSPRRVPALLSTAIADGRLHAALDRVVRDPELGDGRDDSCLLVKRDQETVYELRGDHTYAPASTIKLLTAIAALKRLGPDAHLDTKAVAKAAPRDGVIAGDLWLVGGGDPLLGTADYAGSFKDQPRLFTDLGKLADDVVKAGVRSIDGRILGDESRYDTERYIPSWKPIYATDGDVGPLSALAFNDGFVAWKPKAVPTPVPAGHAAAVFTDLLKARGVTVAGEPSQETAPKNARTLATLPSLPVRQIVGEMLVHSDNETAELLTKELGVRFGGGGSTGAGLGVIRTTVAATGVTIGSLAANDGSGLDPTDRVSCAVLSGLLVGTNREALLNAGLAVAGRTGTLYDRLENTPATDRLYAKTGTLEGVVGLAGLMQPNDGDASRPLTFAFLANGLPRPSEARGKRITDRLALALAAYPDAPVAATLAP